MFERQRRQPSSRADRGLLASATGGALLLSPDDPRLLAVTGFVGLVLFAEALAQARGSRLRAAGFGLVFGTCANATALFSLVPLLGTFAGLPTWLALPLAALAWLAQGLLFALAAALAVHAEGRGAPRWMLLPLTLMTTLGLGPALFPWHVAATQIGFLPFVQLAELGGQTLIGLLLTSAACSTHGLLRATGRERQRLAAIALASVLLPTAYGIVRLASVRRMRDDAETLRVGVVQSNVALDDKRAQRHDEARARDNLAGLRALSAEVGRRGVDLTVWGETAYPYPLRRAAARAPEDAVRRVLDDTVRGPILLGLETYAGFDEAAPKYNSAWLLKPDGALGDRVDKARLLAFGEYIPFWSLLPPIRTRYASPGFQAGVPGTVRVRGSQLGVLICYEDLFASAARETVLLGARALLNLTNDAWFGHSREPLLHDLLARMRSIELRRDLVRAVNTGVSSFTSATGESLHKTRTFERASFVAPVRLLDVQTPYARFGDWLLPLCLLGSSVCALRRRSVSKGVSAGDQ